MFTKVYNSKDICNALEIYRKVKSFRIAASITSVSKSTIHRWWNSFDRFIHRQRIQKYKRTKRKRKPKYPNIHLHIHDIFSTSQSPKSLKQIHTMLGYSSMSWVYRTLKTNRISNRRFSSSTVVRSESDRMARLQDFSKQLSMLENNQIVCIDETGFCNIGNTFYGFYPMAKHPSIISVPSRQTVSVAVAIHPDEGIIAHQIQSNPFKTDTFKEFVSSMLLKLPKTVKVIIIDNIAFHRNKEIRKLIEQKGITCLFIPPYTPRCNPIEEFFSVLKHDFRSMNPKGNISEIVGQVLENRKAYKGILSFYNHTRSFCSSNMTCLK